MKHKFDILMNQLMGSGDGGGGGAVEPAAATPAADPAAVPGSEPANLQPDQSQLNAILNDDATFANNWWQNYESLADRGKSLSKFKDPEGLAKSYHELEKSKGVPGADASEEAIAAFRAANAIPNEAKGYELKLPEELQGDVKQAVEAELPQWLDKFHSINLTPHQAQQLADTQMGMIQEAMQNQQAQQYEAEQAAIQGLQKEWGPAYKANLDKAQKVFDRFAAAAGVDPAQISFTNDPAFAKMMAAIGAEMGESSFAKTSGETPAELRGGAHEADQIITNKDHPDNSAYWNPSDSRHREVQDRVARMLQQG